VRFSSSSAAAGAGAGAEDLPLPALVGLSYRDAKAASRRYQAAKQALHGFYSSARGGGGMGQHWLSRRLATAPGKLGLCGLSADQSTAARAAAAPLSQAAQPPSLPAGLSFKASAVDRDEVFPALPMRGGL
jgi:hypothetical protein